MSKGTGTDFKGPGSRIYGLGWCLANAIQNG